MGNADILPNIWMRTANCGQFFPSLQTLPPGWNTEVSRHRVITSVLGLEPGPRALWWGHAPATSLPPLSGPQLAHFGLFVGVFRCGLRS